jgi:hypothetical protein
MQGPCFDLLLDNAKIIKSSFIWQPWTFFFFDLFSFLEFFFSSFSGFESFDKSDLTWNEATVQILRL